MRKAPPSVGVTFAVDAVEPETEPLPESRMHRVAKELLGDAVESCSDYHGSVVETRHYHPFLAAVYTAFNTHRPLVLTPDAVWVTILQGVGHHMALHGERLRSRFVPYQGKQDLVFEHDGWVEGSPENPWPDAFEAWADQIRRHVGPDRHDALVCDFSTTGPLERAVSRIVMMDIFERYFHYRAVGICGIPTVTLEGTTADWQRLADKVAALAPFDLDWWLAHLRPICAQFVRASRGDIDRDHWQGICKLRSAYGGDIINGWVAKLFPYLRAFYNGPCNRRNPIFDTGEGFSSLSAPTGLSMVPFTWTNRRTRLTRLMEVVGGFLGVSQDPATRALRPKLGWAVRRRTASEALLARVSRDHGTHPGYRTDEIGDDGVPADLAAFYHHTDGAEFFPAGGSDACRVVPRGEMEPLPWGVAEDFRGRRAVVWHRFAWLPDGRWLAINLDSGCPFTPGGKRVREDQDSDDFATICVGRGDGPTLGENPVVAVTFTELLERLLNSGGTSDWLTPDRYGDAEEFTWRGDE